MQTTIHQMNEVLSGWKRLFDPCDTFHLSITETASSTICFNGEKCYPITATRLSSARITISRIRFQFENGQILALLIDWPEDQGPHLGGTLHCKRMLRHPPSGPHRWTHPMWITVSRQDPPGWTETNTYRKDRMSRYE